MMMVTNKSIALAFFLIGFIFTGFSVSAGGSKEVSAVEEKQPEQENETVYPPKGWVTDISEAYKKAQAEDKEILVNFTGSDWCVWCKRLSEEVFTTPEFLAYSDDNLVKLFLDFPNTIDLSEEQVFHNQVIGQVLGVQGYPSIWLMDKNLAPLMVTGYREGGADEYIRHLEEDRPDVSQEEREAFKAAFIEAIESNIGPLN